MRARETIALKPGGTGIGRRTGWRSSGLMSDIVMCVVLGAAYYAVARLSLQ